MEFRHCYHDKNSEITKTKYLIDKLKELKNEDNTYNLLLNRIPVCATFFRFAFGFSEKKWKSVKDTIAGISETDPIHKHRAKTKAAKNVRIFSIVEPYI